MPISLVFVMGQGCYSPITLFKKRSEADLRITLEPERGWREHRSSPNYFHQATSSTPSQLRNATYFFVFFVSL